MNSTDAGGLQDLSSAQPTQLPIIEKAFEFKKKLEKSGIQLGGQEDLCQNFNKKQAEEKGLKTRDPGTKGLSITFSF